MNPPATMTIELEEKDVRNDLPEVVNAMSKMRAETIKDRKLTDEQKDEYLHMSYRLASGIQSVADEPMTKRMQIVADRLNKNPMLLRYDPMQDGYWRKQEGRFAEALDDLLIATVRDDFHSVDAKHHVLQAVKYLGVEDTPSKEREKVYDTILPFHGPVPLETRENLLKKIFGRLLGNQYKLSNLEGLALNIDATSEGFTDEFMQMARDRGYTTLRVEMTKEEYERIKEQLKSAQVVDAREREKKKTALISIANGLVRCTKPISYPILGALPKALQDNLHYSLFNFNKKNAFTASCWIEIGGSVLGATVLAISQGSGWYFLAGLPTLLDGAIRGWSGLEPDPDNERDLIYTNSYGSVFLKPFFAPLEDYFGKKPSEFVTVELPVRKIEASQQVPNPIAFYDAIGKMEVPEDVERNLVWDNENHHQFGKSFMAYVKEHAGTQPQGIEIATSINKPNQAIVYNHELPVDGYRKYSSLFCFNGRRYLLTAVEPNKGTNNFVENASTILADGSDNQKKLERLGKELDARYVHLREYKGGQVTSDMEGFG